MIISHVKRILPMRIFKFYLIIIHIIYAYLCIKDIYHTMANYKSMKIECYIRPPFIKWNCFVIECHNWNMEWANANEVYACFLHCFSTFVKKQFKYFKIGVGKYANIYIYLYKIGIIEIERGPKLCRVTYSVVWSLRIIYKISGFI